MTSQEAAAWDAREQAWADYNAMKEKARAGDRGRWIVAESIMEERVLPAAALCGQLTKGD